MDKNLIEQLILFNSDKLPRESLPYLQHMLIDMDTQIVQMRFASFKDPMTALLISIFVGTFGVDRFYTGDIGLGILKFITCGGFGIWWLYDLFVIMDIVRKKNYQILASGISY